MATKPEPSVPDPHKSESANPFKAGDKSSNIYQGNPWEDADKLSKEHHVFSTCVLHLRLTDTLWKLSASLRASETQHCLQKAMLSSYRPCKS